jgi:hypothetical protein
VIDHYRPDLTTLAIFTVYDSEVERLADYFVRSALVRAMDQAAYQHRYMAGQRIKQRVRMGPKLAQVTPLRRVAK